MSYEEIEYLYKNGEWVMGVEGRTRAEFLKSLPDSYKLVSTITFVEGDKLLLLDTFKIVPFSERL